jgi:hypothetical protein
MLTQLTLAAIAGLLLHVEAVKQPPTAPPQKVNVILGKTAAQAVAFAAAKSAGKTEPIFVVASMRFVEDGALAWTASDRAFPGRPIRAGDLT